LYQYRPDCFTYVPPGIPIPTFPESLQKNEKAVVSAQEKIKKNFMLAQEWDVNNDPTGW
jgi:hypothetical protein